MSGEPAKAGRDEVRLDKWLWAARFFKTRQLAVEAVNGGKVKLSGQPVKPGRGIRVGTHLTIHKGSLEWDIEVLGLSRQRLSAPQAALLYSESEQSRERRQQIVRERREARIEVHPGERPTKRDRRQLERFIGKQDG